MPICCVYYLLLLGLFCLDMCGSRIYPYHHQERKKEVGREGVGGVGCGGSVSIISLPNPMN